MQKYANRYGRADAKEDNLLYRWLRESLRLGERVLALVERLKRNDVLKHIYI